MTQAILALKDSRHWKPKLYKTSTFLKLRYPLPSISIKKSKTWYLLPVISINSGTHYQVSVLKKKKRVLDTGYQYQLCYPLTSISYQKKKTWYPVLLSVSSIGTHYWVSISCQYLTTDSCFADLCFQTTFFCLFLK